MQKLFNPAETIQSGRNYSIQQKLSNNKQSQYMFAIDFVLMQTIVF